MHQIFKQIGIPESRYFLTGSRALDTDFSRVSTDKSDYDYVVFISFRSVILSYLQRHNIPIEMSCYNGGFKFTINDKTYNIISAIPIEFMAWREALSTLKNLVNTDKSYLPSIQNKLSRYCLYESLRAIFKTALAFSNYGK